MFASQIKITDQLIRNQGEEPAKTTKLSLRSMKLTVILIFYIENRKFRLISAFVGIELKS